MTPARELADPRPRRRRGAAFGYTIVELVMSLSVLAIGVAGIMGMQRVTISANRHAKNLSLATRIAQGWVDELAADAALWTVSAGRSTLASTVWLNVAAPNAIVDWYVPAYSAVRAFGPGFGALGDPVDHLAAPKLVQFCTQLRLAFVKPETDAAGNLAPGGVIRTQVRVFWRREDSVSTLGGAAAPGGDDLCSLTGAQLDADLDSFHVVYLTSAVREAERSLLP